MRGRVTVLVLAAGRSTRMRGRDKLLECVGGEPLLRRQARFATSVSDDVVVVVPASEPARELALEGLPVRVVRAATRPVEMSASIAAGLATISDGCSGVLLLLADMPELEAADLGALLRRHGERAGAIIRAASADGTPGHPVLFPADLMPRLLRLDGDRGARGLLRDTGRAVELVRLPGRRALVDLDTPEDWDRWRGDAGIGSRGTA